MKTLTTTIGTFLAACTVLATFAGEKARTPEKAIRSIYIDARQLKGEKNMTREKDPDNFQYARSKDAGGIEFTVTPQQAGQWYVFATVRIGAVVPLDQEAGLLSIYKTADEKLGTLRISGSPGDDSWQTLCVGKYTLTPGMRIVALPGTARPPRFLDVKSILFLDPTVMESSRPQP